MRKFAAYIPWAAVHFLTVVRSPGSDLFLGWLSVRLARPTASWVQASNPDADAGAPTYSLAAGIGWLLTRAKLKTHSPSSCPCQWELDIEVAKPRRVLGFKAIVRVAELDLLVSLDVVCGVSIAVVIVHIRRSKWSFGRGDRHWTGVDQDKNIRVSTTKHKKTVTPLKIPNLFKSKSNSCLN